MALMPAPLAWVILLSFGLGFAAKDLKDVAGDRATGVWSLPVLLGRTGGRFFRPLGVAFIGILSAMLALQLERAREFATLRALGMTPTQVGGMITTQTGVIGLLSGLAAVPLGVIMAWVLIKVINRRAFGWQIDMTVTADILAVSVVFAIGAALLAGLYPAWRAGRSQPAIAMREE